MCHRTAWSPCDGTSIASAGLLSASSQRPGAARGAWLCGVRLVAGPSGLEGACMSGGVANVVLSGPLILAVPVAVAAGAVTFLSPCVLPLVPGYLSYVTGMSGTAASQERTP